MNIVRSLLTIAAGTVVTVLSLTPPAHAALSPGLHAHLQMHVSPGVCLDYYELATVHVIDPVPPREPLWDLTLYGADVTIC